MIQYIWRADLKQRLVTWLHIALFIMDLSCQGFLCVWIISIFLWVKGEPFSWDPHPWLPPHSPYALPLSLQIALLHSPPPPPSQTAERAIYFVCFSPVAALLFNSDHVNHQSEGGLWVNLVLNLNWLVQRQSEYFFLLLFSAFAH